MAPGRQRPERRRRWASTCAAAAALAMAASVPSPFAWMLGLHPGSAEGLRRRGVQASRVGLAARGRGDMSALALAEKLREQGLQAKDASTSAKAGALLAELIELLAVEKEDVAARVEEDPTKEKAERLFAELSSLAPEVSVEDYFDAESKEWDIEGLEHDLQLSRSEAPAAQAAAPAAAAPAETDRADRLFAELSQLSSDVSREDYFDADSKEWDVEGLEHDLEISRSQAAKAPAVEAAAPAAVAPADTARAERLFAELKQLAPEVSREDYYFDEEWDVEGLEHDLELSRSQAAKAPAVEAAAPAAAAPADSARAERLFAELKQLAPEVSREDYYFDEEWDVEGLEHDLELSRSQAAKAPAVEAAAPAAAAPADSARAERLFAELKQLAPEVSREDYYSDEEWDVEGLEHDLELSRSQAAKAPAVEAAAPAAAAPADAARAERLFAELAQLAPEVGREDYFDAESKEWDIEGLEHDLQLSRSSAPAAAAPEASSSEGRALLAELQQMDPGASEEDYFDEASGIWDMEGLREDVKLAQEKQGTAASAVAAAVAATTPADSAEEAEAMLAKLIAMDPRVTKEDYFDPDTGTWDLQGLRDDVALASQPSADSGPEGHDSVKDLLLGKEPPASSGIDPEGLMAQLLELNPTASREDYFDEAAAEWDLEGLQEDLRLLQAVA
eukprot:TRINITY_DN4803_c0_g1_i4.p1 TRINITY_DN4803_c0_g1~~TRINITY_DN4803_c0_g1_i4.p1  ORF type:complete len:677 (-),score=253.16 TRINITY_DN4803_c0_g1_i4:93-2123(-)